jgi:hypothetical protein
LGIGRRAERDIDFFRHDPIVSNVIRLNCSKGHFKVVGIGAWTFGMHATNHFPKSSKKRQARTNTLMLVIYL